VSAADPTAALAAFLLSNVGSLVDGRVFRPKVPRTEDEFMPRACIVVRNAGGYQLFGDSYLPVGDPRLDVIAYGGSDLEADNIARECLLALKGLQTSVWADCVVHWCKISAGIIPLVDQETNWPFSQFSTQVMVTELAVA